MKKKLARIFAASLVAVFLVMMLPFGASAVNLLVTTTPSEETAEWEYSGWTDIPLLVIKINYAPENGTQTFIKTTDDTYWYEMLFGDGEKSMKSYWETISDGNFRFTPATENYVNEEHINVANDGIVEVTSRRRSLLLPLSAQAMRRPETARRVQATMRFGLVLLLPPTG